MIKFYLKKTQLWKFISQSTIYKKFRDPENYRKQQVEPNFYKRILKMHPSRNNLIFDVGANIGSKSIIFSKLARKVVSFEPSEKLFIFLQKKFANTNVILFNYALGNSVSKSDLYIVENNEAYNSLNKKHIEITATSRNIATIDTVKHQQVNVEIIENFITKFGIPKYIKIDVEGYEYEVIKGLKTTVPIISFEANLPEFSEESIQIIKYLDELSLNRYKYNFTVSNSFIMKNFIAKEEAINFLIDTNLQYVEIYAILDLKSK
ncbi:FkbM family methyltransferase [Gillisia sp. JM1]|uniref:FkbM family methyltransferase n=1 Tax=Gillisia sp. JM1 TaxID=1283286 RepID=UPI00054FBE5E|nr:FkbM family methyltransferase [Gillisia sp. JM1]